MFKRNFGFVVAVLFLLAVVALYWGNNRAIAYHYINTFLNGSEVALGDNVYRVNNDLVSIVSIDKNVYRLKLKNSDTKSEMLLLRMSGFEISEMVLKGLLREEKEFESAECSAYRFNEINNLSQKTLVKFNDSPLELITDSTPSSDEIENKYCLAVIGQIS